MDIRQSMTNRMKLIEVALPLDAINSAAAREKSIRHGHPSTLHLYKPDNWRAAQVRNIGSIERFNPTI